MSNPFPNPTGRPGGVSFGIEAEALVSGSLRLRTTRSSGTPHPVDAHVGRRLRLLRKAARLSQGQLAAKVGTTFQQLQKYESAGNRISASKLYEIVTALDVPVTSLFDGLPGPAAAGDGSGDPLHALFEQLMMTSGGPEIAKHFTRLPSAEIRETFVRMIRIAAGEDNQGIACERDRSVP